MAYGSVLVGVFQWITTAPRSQQGTVAPLDPRGCASLELLTTHLLPET